LAEPVSGTRNPDAGRPFARKDRSPMYLDWFNNVVVPIAQFIGIVGGILFVWWQVRQIREVNAYGLLRDEVKRFNSPELRGCRARLARTLLASRRDFEKIDEDGEEVCGYFEGIGMLLRRKVVPVYYIWTMQSYEILFYGQLLRDYIAWVRQSTKDHTFYIEFDLLRDRVAALQKKRSGLEPVYTEDELREFLDDEADVAAGADHKKSKRERRLFQVRCPHCEQRLSVTTSNLGRTRKCPRCSGEFTLEQTGE
jgi:hypothetical protein